MKTFALLAFVLFAGHAACSAQNPIDLAKKELPSIVVLGQEEPLGKDNATCQGLWWREGFVCDYDKLKALAAADQKKLSDATASFVQSITKNRELAVKLNDAKKAAFNANQLVFNPVNTKTEAEKCWNYMIKLRSSALCSICSAKNYLYFLNNKGAISFDTCNDFLSYCMPHFRDLLSLIELGNSMSEIVRLKQEARPVTSKNQMEEIMFRIHTIANNQFSNDFSANIKKFVKVKEDYEKAIQDSTTSPP